MDEFLASLNSSARQAKRDISVLNPAGGAGGQLSRADAFSARFRASAGIPGRALTAIPQSVPDTPGDVNDVIQQRDFVEAPRIKPYSRMYLSVMGFPAPGYGQLAFVRKSAPRSRNAKTQFYANQQAYGLTIPGEALFAVSPLHMNYLLTQMQLEQAGKEPDAYLDLTPQALYHGYFGDGTRVFGDLFPDYDGWHLDGVVEFERGETGGSTRLNEGYGTTAEGLVTGPPPSAHKSVTVSTFGRVMMNDFWTGHGIQENSTLFAILRKSPIVTPADPSTLYYTLAQKPVDALIQGLDDNKVTSIGYPVRNATVNVNGVDKPLQPYEWHFYADPAGGTCLPDKRLRCYRDERGYMRSDALVLRVGRVKFAAAGTYMNNAKRQETLTPLRDGRTVMQRGMLDVVLSCDDGLFGSAV